MLEPDAAAIREIFLCQLPSSRRARLAAWPTLERTLQELVRRARAAWPGIALAPEIFLAHVAARVPAGAENDGALLALHAGDLHLACACLHRHPTALAAFEPHCLRRLLPALVRSCAAHEVADVLQAVREKLLVGEGGRPPRLAQYSGRGDLRSWVRVTVAYEISDRQLRVQRELPLDDAILQTASPEEDPELAYLRRLYGEAFRSAFREALGRLSSRERNILRYSLLHGLDIDQIAALYGVHRPTVARWIARVRRTILDGTRFGLKRRLDQQADQRRCGSPPPRLA